MNSYPINGDALNSGGYLASVVYIPAATASFDIALVERISVQLSGALGSGMTLTGDISKVSNLGNAPLALTVTASGSLTNNRMIYFDSATINTGLQPAGTLNTVVLGTSGSSAWGIGLSGDMDRRVLLSGNTNPTFDTQGNLIAIKRLTADPVVVSFTPAGNLNGINRLAGVSVMSTALSGSLSSGSRVYFSPSAVVINFAPTGELASTGRMSGSVASTWEAQGNISRMQNLSGTITGQLTATGSLSNNAAGNDLEAFLMIRRETKREMTR